MNNLNSVFDYIRYNQFNWFSHVRRTNEICWKILKRCPHRRRRRRRWKEKPRNSWIQEPITGMRDVGINRIEMDRRKEWRKKIN